MPDAVHATQLEFRYGDRLALAGVSFSVAPASIFALLGPNGGGKTTLFRILATLARPHAGTFTIAGETDARSVRRKLGVVFQSPSLDKKLTVLENMLFGGALFGLSGASLRKRAEELLARFSVADRSGDLVETLSGGLARRVEIAKSLLHRPEVLLLDEPSTGLDPVARRDLRGVLHSLSRDERVTVLLTTHLFEEADAADHIAILDRGHLVAEGTPAELKRSLSGDVLVVEPREEESATDLAAAITQRFGDAAGRVAAVSGLVRLERADAHAFVPPLVEAFPGRFRSVTLGAPSLEDVFVARTGRLFREEDAPDAPAGVRE